MSEAVHLTIEMGDQMLKRRIATLQKGIHDFSPLWPRVRDWFHLAMAAQFSTEGRTRWKPLAASTVAQRAAKGFGASHPILERTGALLGSYLGGTGAIDESTPMSIRLGSALTTPDGSWFLGALHQTGTSKMPARPVFGTDVGTITRLWPSDLADLRGIFDQYIHDLATKK